jgi:hypothetical protein
MAGTNFGSVRPAAFGPFAPLALAACLGLSLTAFARAEEAKEEYETKYVFGFTEGSGIGAKGESEFLPDTVVNSGKRDGQYTATATELTFAYTPSKSIQFEFGPIVAYHDIQNVTGLADLNDGAFGGIFGELRYLLHERSASSPLAVTLSIEPDWRTANEVTGQGVVNYGLATSVNADLEVIKNRGYLGFNLLYEPERTLNPDSTTDDESTLGISAAFAYRLLPNITIAAETWYMRHYAGIGPSPFTGDAVYVGPSLYLQVTPKIFASFAWNTQVAGHEVGGANLDLDDFSRNRFKLRAAVQF